MAVQRSAALSSVSEVILSRRFFRLSRALRVEGMAGMQRAFSL